MALEDRCSPQSAPSPPGLPQSPNNNYGHNLQADTASILDMSLHQVGSMHPVATTILPHPAAAVATNATTAAALYQHQQLQQLHHLQQLQQLHQQHLGVAAAAAFQVHHTGFEAAAAGHAAAAAAAALQQRLAGSPSGHSTSSTPASSLTIKEEENDSIMGDSFQANEHDQTGTTAGTEDEEDDIDVDDVDEHNMPHNQRSPPPAHQQSKPSLAFSISNILSDRFGGAEAAANKCESKSLNGMYRPFDAARAATATPSAFTRVDLLEFSRQQQAAAAAATAAMMLERANFLNCFNPAAYPRIHEEIVNSRLRRSAAGLASPTAKTNAESSANEKSALGSLCKAVSQIGQSVPPPAPSVASSVSSASCIASPPPAGSMSSASSSLSAASGSSHNSSPSSRQPTNSSPQPIPPPSAVSRDSGMESSDDTRSETGSTTTEGGKNEMWPAWVYCTRYSDRPSSGKFFFFFLIVNK